MRKLSFNAKPPGDKIKIDQVTFCIPQLQSVPEPIFRQQRLTKTQNKDTVQVSDNRIPSLDKQ